MQERFKYTNRIVFTFVTVALVLLISFATLIIIKNKSFVSKVYFETVLDDASFLSSKPSIYFKGFQIGRIDHFELDSKTNTILVKFYIYENYRDKIIKYAVISRKENQLLGTSNQYEILLPYQELALQMSPLDEGSLVPFIDSEIGRTFAKKGRIKESTDSIESIITSVNNLLLNLQKSNNPEDGTLFDILDKSAKIADSVLAISQQAQNEQLVFEIKKTINSMQTLIETSSTTIKTVEATLTNANVLLGNADNLIAHSNHAVRAYDNPAEIISTVTQDKLPELINNLNTSLIYLQDIVKEAHLQREQLGLAIISLSKTLGLLEKTLQGVNNNPLIKDGIEPEPEPGGIEINAN